MTIAEQFAQLVKTDLRAVVQAAEVILVGRKEYYRAISLETIERAASRRGRVAFIFGDGSSVVAP